jgi:hypothetical protein
MIDYSKIELMRLPVLKSFFQKRYGDDWYSLEPETISLDLGIELSALLADKIWVLKISAFDPELIYDDLMFFAHAIAVINNFPADFDHMPVSNALELSYGVIEILSLTKPIEWSKAIKEYILFCLREDGFGYVPKPLSLITGDVKLGDHEEPLSDKVQKDTAIKTYIAEMMK